MGKSRPERYFFEIPIYISTSKVYSAKIDEAVDRHLKNLLVRSGVPREEAPRTYRLSEEHFRNTQGGPWRYNQVVGWIRLYVLGSQIRGETWFVTAKRIRRDMRKKRFKYYGKAFEAHIFPEESNPEIYDKLLSSLSGLERQRPFKGRHLDLESLRSIGPLVDWRRLLALEKGVRNG